MNDLINTLNEFTGDVNELSEELNIAPSEIGKIWYELLRELKEKDISKMEVNEESVLEWIKNQSNFKTYQKDGDEGLSSELYGYVYHYGDFWNESIIDAIAYFRKFIEYTDDELTEEEAEEVAGRLERQAAALEFLINANAGNSFYYRATSEDPDERIYWVNPECNNETDRTAYVNTRGDCTFDALEKYIHMQYTHAQPDDPSVRPDNSLGAGNGIRLLMPMNSHHVEVEDLDRNFWVISGVLNTLVKELTQEDTPIREMFKKLFDEITQLWENIAYLWMTLAAASQPQSNDIHIEVVQIPNNDYQIYKKFDDFNNIDGNVVSRVKYLQYKYSEQNILVLPVFRNTHNDSSTNYYRNYYNVESYRYICYFDRSSNQWIYTSINFNGNFLNIKVEDYAEIIGAARENKDTYSYCAPLEDVDAYEDDGKYYYGALRIIPEIEAELVDGGIKITKLNLKVYDAMSALVNSNDDDNLIKMYYLEEPIVLSQYHPIELKEISIRESINESPIITIKHHNSKYYLGEIPSSRKATINPQFKKSQFQIVKIGDFLPINVVREPNKFEYITNQTGGAYDTDTYGIGAFKLINAADVDDTTAYHLKFVNYNWYDYYFDDISDYKKGIDKPSIETLEGYEVTPEVLTEISKQRIKNLVKLNMLEDKDGIYATKIGISYWTGTNGVQWSSGLVCNLIYYNAETKEAENMGFIGMLDGYWTKDTAIFETVSGGQWRRLCLKADKVTIKTVGDEKTFTMKGGRLIWYDHNKEVYDGNYEPESNRPRATMTLENGKLIFSQPINPIDANKQMYPYIDYKPDEHIFKENSAQLVVNDVHGVQDWKDYSSDSTIGMDLHTPKNDGAYIVTLRP